MMLSRDRAAALVVGACLALAACGAPGAGTGPIPNPSASACALADGTTPTETANPAGCHVLSRDTSGCESSRLAAGLSGYWLKFSCRVTLSPGGGQVRASSDGQPDYPSNYFPKTNACY